MSCTTYELKPVHDHHKSFYGRAEVREFDAGRSRVLYSYDTPVCWIDTRRMEFHRLWDDWSRTTMTHVAEFCRQVADDLAEMYGPERDDTPILVVSKADWESRPVERDYPK